MPKPVNTSLLRFASLRRSAIFSAAFRQIIPAFHSWKAAITSTTGACIDQFQDAVEEEISKQYCRQKERGDALSVFREVPPKKADP